MKSDTARLEIALDSGLWRMPDGAGWTASSGRAHVKASVVKGKTGQPVLEIESGCDSLERLCAMYAAENERLTTDNAELQSSLRTETEERLNGVCGWRVWLMGMAGIVAGVALTIIITRKGKWKRQY